VSLIQALSFNRQADELESWMDDVELQLSSEDHGKDIISVSNLLKKHQVQRLREFCDIFRTHTAVLRPFVLDYPGGPVPEETFTHSLLKCVVGVCHHSGFYEAWGRYSRQVRRHGISVILIKKPTTSM